MEISHEPPLASTRLPHQILDYLPQYRVARCVLCNYAVPPSALSRHMKDLHHIYREKRKALLEYAITLDLVDPEDLILPEPHEPPIPSLPIENGAACNRCKHLCVTAKRMKRHWVTTHEQKGLLGKHWRAVKLQTFFRGNNLRYFIVTPVEEVRTSETQAEMTHSALQQRYTNSPPLPNFCALPRDISIAGSGLNIIERELFYQYTRATCSSILPSGEEILPWLTAIPQLAQEFPFIMHAILSISALHLAFLNPMHRQRCIITATHYQGQALQSFRSKVRKVDENNCYAMFVFSRLIVLHELASTNSSIKSLPEPDNCDSGQRTESIIPQWLKLQIDAFKIIQPYRAITFSKHQQPSPSAMVVYQSAHIDLACNPWDLKFLALAPLFENDKGPGGLSGNDLMENTTCATAFNGLRHAFALPYAMRDSGRFYDAVIFWPLTQGDDFFHLVNSGKPKAMIVLAFYCVLLKYVDNYWFMNEHGRKLLSNINQRLGNEWRCWIQWPLKELGLEADSILPPPSHF